MSMIQTNISVINNSKFKTASIGCFLRLPLTKHNLAYTSLLAKMQENGSLYYPAPDRQLKRLRELYDLQLEIVPQLFGDQIVLSYLVNYVAPSLVLDPDYTETDIVETINAIFLHPAITEPLLQLSKKQLQDEYQELMHEPANLALAHFFKFWYEAEPEYNGTFIGDMEEIMQATVPQLRLFAKNMRVVPAQVIAISDSGNLQSLLRKNIKSAGLLKEFMVTSLTIAAKKEAEQHRKKINAQQTQLLLGYGFKKKETLREQVSASFLAQYLTRDNNSKLFAAIREQNGAAYSVSAASYSNNSLFLINAGLAPEKLALTINIIKTEMSRLRAGQVDADLFKQIKKAMISDLLVQEDSANYQIMHSLRSALIAGYKELDQKQVLRRLTADDLTAFAQNLELKESYILQ